MLKLMTLFLMYYEVDRKGTNFEGSCIYIYVCSYMLFGYGDLVQLVHIMMVMCSRVLNYVNGCLLVKHKTCKLGEWCGGMNRPHVADSAISSSRSHCGH